MTVIVTADLHLTDNPRDEYRWQLFSWLHKQVKKTGAKHVLILGDLTDAKDRHSAALVNRIAKELSQLSESAQIILLRGNHDFIDEKHPFFEFLDYFHPHIIYINQITEFSVDDGVHGSRTQRSAVFLPCTRDYKNEWRSLDELARIVGGNFIKDKRAYVFTHQTYDGAKAENGQSLQGVPPGFFDGFAGQVISGDIHVPQNINKHICYVGSPYRIHFGDSFSPRVILLRNGQIESIPTNFTSRELIEARNIRDVEKHKLPSGTQIKLRFHLKRSEFGDKNALRDAAMELAKARDWDICGLEFKAMTIREAKDEEAASDRTKMTPTDIVAQYAKAKKLPKEVWEAGLGILKEVQ